MHGEDQECARRQAQFLYHYFLDRELGLSQLCRDAWRERCRDPLAGERIPRKREDRDGPTLGGVGGFSQIIPGTQKRLNYLPIKSFSEHDSVESTSTNGDPSPGSGHAL